MFKSGFFTSLWLLAIVVAVNPALADESHCESGVGENRALTPASAFELPHDGTVVHTATGLQWAQCAIGQDWNRNSCLGTAEVFTWNDARAAIDALNGNGGLAGFTDWRLPTREELESIAETCREAPAINSNIFPNTPWAGFWSSSSGDSNSEHAWFVGFYYGLAFEYSQAASYRVRPVRIR